MNTSGDAAEQIVRMSLEGFQVTAKIAGSGAKDIAALLIAIMKDKHKTAGKTNLSNMLKSGKELKVFSVRKDEFKKFTEEAKRYGVLYSALINKKDKSSDGIIDIMVRAEDAAKINRIVERFKLTTLNPAQIETEIQEEIAKKEENNIGVQTKNKEELEQDISFKKPLQKEDIDTSNFSMAKTETSRPSEPYSKISREANNENRKSVRKELQDIKEEMKDLKSKDKTVTKTKNKSKKIK